MGHLSRRSLLGGLGGGAMALVSSGVWGRGRPVLPRAGLADRVLETPRARIFDLASELIEGGVAWRELEAALFLAGLRATRPYPPGTLSHAFLQSESIFQLAEAGPEDEAWLGVLFHLDDLKALQAGEEARSGWTLGPAPEVRRWGAEKALAELEAACRRSERPAADLAVTTLIRRGGATQGLELLRRRAGMDLDGVGHKPIHAAHTERVLNRMADGPTRTETELAALRSLALALASPAGPDALTHGRAARAQAPKVPAEAERGAAQPEVSRAVARLLAKADPGPARDGVLEALLSGASAASVRDGVRLAACEILARSPSLLPVHPTTVANALAYLGRTERDPVERQALLLHAVSAVPHLRHALWAFTDLPREPVLDSLLAEPSSESQGLEPTLARPTPGAVRAHLEGGGRERFLARVRGLLHRGAEQHHQHKYLAALVEDVSLAHPSLGPLLLSPSLGYLPTPRDEPSEVYERSRGLLKALGR